MAVLEKPGLFASASERSVGARDRERLDQYFTGVRELEQRMTMQQEWEHKPRPKTTSPMPLDPASPREYMEKVRLMYDMARLAFETDSCRFISLLLDSVNSPAIEVDGKAWHFNAERRTADIKRDADLAALGWLTLRFTYEQIGIDADWVIRCVRESLAGRTKIG